MNIFITQLLKSGFKGEDLWKETEVHSKHFKERAALRGNKSFISEFSEKAAE